jgi:hypothetical protein
MSEDAGQTGEIVVEASPDDEEVDQEEVAVEVERMLIRDEARVIAGVSLLCIVIGALFALGWVFVAWRTESDLSNGGRGSGVGFGSGDPDLVDRINALEQVGILLMFALLLVASGCGLRLYASRVSAERPD